MAEWAKELTMMNKLDLRIQFSLEVARLKMVKIETMVELFQVSMPVRSKENQKESHLRILTHMSRKKNPREYLGDHQEFKEKGEPIALIHLQRISITLSRP